jgi:hypothetical protein
MGHVLGDQAWQEPGHWKSEVAVTRLLQQLELVAPKVTLSVCGTSVRGCETSI